MYIEHFNQNKRKRQNHPPTKTKEEKIDRFLTGRPEKKPEAMLEPPHDMLISEHSRDVLSHWRAPEFERYERDKKWYFYITLILLAIIAWALYTNSPVMAITFILIGVVGYIYAERDPSLLDFMITYDGVLAGREFYDFDHIESFWIFYEPPHTKILSLKTSSLLLPYVHIPIHEEDPVHLRTLLLDFIPEEKQEEGLVQAMERLLKI